MPIKKKLNSQIFLGELINCVPYLTCCLSVSYSYFHLELSEDDPSKKQSCSSLFLVEFGLNFCHARISSECREEIMDLRVRSNVGWELGAFQFSFIKLGSRKKKGDGI